MGSRLKSYLRYYRRRAGLTQRQLAQLLGLKSESVISRIERDVARPTLKLLFACRVIFGVSPREIFPNAFGEVADALITRARSIREQLRSATDNTKTKALSDVVEQLTGPGATSNA